MRRISPREAKRMMQRMGLSMTPIEVDEVILKAKDKEIIIEGPEVAVLEVQGQRIFQISGGRISEKHFEKKIAIPDEDVLLVAQQANVSLEEARTALEQTKGDLAQAILLLSQK
ncbi:MAG: nascent polypeptide-associated complex protein [candidate division WOR-3 bacterium]|nr:nascent polypeptide-associated complex protein [Candidatus Bathyarchaeota archaeon]